MKRQILISGLATMLMLVAGTVSAAEAGQAADPLALRLSDAQMENVTAGQTSTAGGWSSVLLGRSYSVSSTTAISSGVVNHTSATSLNTAIGIGANANAWGWTTF